METQNLWDAAIFEYFCRYTTGDEKPSAYTSSGNFPLSDRHINCMAAASQCLRELRWT